MLFPTREYVGSLKSGWIRWPTSRARPITHGRRWPAFSRSPKIKERIPINPCERGGQLYRTDRTDRLWTESDLARLLSIASPEMELTVLLALGTGQRQGDLLRLRWSDYDGKHIRLRQSKLGQAVVVRIGGLLKARLDASQRRRAMVLAQHRDGHGPQTGFAPRGRNFANALA